MALTKLPTLAVAAARLDWRLVLSEKESTVLCTDLNPDALQLAKKNANKCGLGNIEFQQSDLLGQVEGDFDLIVSNPPYIRTEEIQHLMSDVRDFEPLMALDGGPDGLTFYRRLIRESSAHLRRTAFLHLKLGTTKRKLSSHYSTSQ